VRVSVSNKEQAAWRAFVRALAVAARLVDADLDAASRLKMADYNILVLLSDQPDHAMRINRLAAHAIWTLRGLTRVIERLSRRGLVDTCTTGPHHLPRAGPKCAATLRYRTLVRRIVNRICRLVGGFG
jgi:hypothetical protein